MMAEDFRHVGTVACLGEHLCQLLSACLQYPAWCTVQVCCLIPINLLKHCSHLVLLENQVSLSSWWADEGGEVSCYEIVLRLC